jgi:arylsulfatase
MSELRREVRVTWVKIDIDSAAEDLDHLISPGERFRLAMAKQ